MNLDSEQILLHQQDIHRRYPSHFDLIYRVNTFCQQAESTFEIHKEDGQEIVAAALMIKLLDDMQAAMILLERGLVPQARILIRAGVETFLILANVCQDTEFSRSFIQSDQRTRRAILNALRQDKSVMFEDVRPHITQELIDELTKDIADHGISEIKAEALARRANLMAFYNGMYRLFSQDVHTSIRVVERYCIFNQNGELTRFSWEPQIANLESVLTVIPRLMLNSFEYLDRLFSH